VRNGKRFSSPSRRWLLRAEQDVSRRSLAPPRPILFGEDWSCRLDGGRLHPDTTREAGRERSLAEPTTLKGLPSPTFLRRKGATLPAAGFEIDNHTTTVQMFWEDARAPEPSRNNCDEQLRKIKIARENRNGVGRPSVLPLFPP